MDGFNPDEWDIHNIVQKCQVSLNNGEKLIIDVHELLSVEQEDKFLAIPDLTPNIARQEFWGRGITKLDAIRACLDKIGGVPIDPIIPEIKENE
jgi:hypothetical protein